MYNGKKEKKREKKGGLGLGVIWRSTYRDLFASSSASWYHSRVGGGTAVNWQWSVASSFLSTTRSSGVTTGLGKLLSASGRRQKMSP